MNPLDAINGKIDEIKDDVEHRIVIKLCRFPVKAILGFLKGEDPNYQEFRDSL